MLAVLVSLLIVFGAPVNAYYIRFNHENESKLSTDSAVVGRIKRVPCEVVLYYDVVCHGRCPPYEKEWNLTREHKNCLDGLVYHCAKDNTTGKYVEACAVPIRCELGKEPRLVFPEGHTKTAFVTCQYCANEEFYNPSEFKLSSTYYMCPKGKRPCDANKGQIPCNVEEGIERHWKTHKCRCDVKQGYIQDFSDHQTDSLCEDSSNLRCIPFQCDPTSNGTAQELLKNYTCVPVCDEGFQRNDTSDLCTPIPSKSSSTVPNKFTIVENPQTVINTTQILTQTTNYLTIETTRVSTSDVKETTPASPTAPPAPTSKNNLVAILCTVIGVMLMAFIIAILYHKEKLRIERSQHKTNKGEQLDQSYTALLKKEEDKEQGASYKDENNANDKLINKITNPNIPSTEEVGVISCEAANDDPEQNKKQEANYKDDNNGKNNANDRLINKITNPNTLPTEEVGVKLCEAANDDPGSTTGDAMGMKHDAKMSQNIVSLNQHMHKELSESSSYSTSKAGKFKKEEKEIKISVPSNVQSVLFKATFEHQGQIAQELIFDAPKNEENKDKGIQPNLYPQTCDDKHTRGRGTKGPFPVFYDKDKY